MTGFFVDGVKWDAAHTGRSIDIAYFYYCHNVNRDADFYAFESTSSKANFLRQDIARAVKNESRLKKLTSYIEFNGGDVLQSKNNSDILYKALLDVSASFMLDREKLAFIERDERTIDFFWSLFHMYSIDLAAYREGRSSELKTSPLAKLNPVVHNDMYIARINSYHERALLSHKLLISTQAINNKDRFNDVVRFFDRWNCSISEKSKHLASMEKIWGIQKNHTDMVKWVKLNQNMYKWAWEYTLENAFNNQVPLWATKDGSNEFIGRQLVIAWDLMFSNPDRQALFMMRFKKAASQQKTRMKRETIKPSTFYLDDDVKKKLNIMVKNLKITKSALIASLIEKADENDLR
ncbi:hypothetical protein [Aeromonas hydrophila]|uniref:hypothetical protein n=1 Tax=Aeromonas hydrophila TaxID=644 RepID=UPI000A5D8B26|nr:hypothetical protein [Aeromonas hydrophila]